MSTARIEKSFCRICQGYCAVEINVEDGKIVQVRGDDATHLDAAPTSRLVDSE